MRAIYGITLFNSQVCFLKIKSNVAFPVTDRVRLGGQAVFGYISVKENVGCAHVFAPLLYY